MKERDGARRVRERGKDEGEKGEGSVGRSVGGSILFLCQRVAAR